MVDARKVEFRTISAGNTGRISDHEVGLVEQMEQGLYRQLFTDPTECESAETMIYNMTKNPHFQLNMLVMGENLDDPDPSKRTIHGFAFVEYYKHAEAGLFTFLAMSKEAQAMGMNAYEMRDQALEMLSGVAAANGGKLQALYSEVNDPRKFRGPKDESPEHAHLMEDSVSPMARLKYMQRMGGRIVGVEAGTDPVAEKWGYVQPELEEGNGPCRSMFLLSYPVDQTTGRASASGSYANPEQTLAFMYNFHQAAAAQKDQDASKVGDLPDLKDDIARLTRMSELGVSGIIERVITEKNIAALPELTPPLASLLAPDEEAKRPPAMWSVTKDAQGKIEYVTIGIAQEAATEKGFGRETAEYLAQRLAEEGYKVGSIATSVKPAVAEAFGTSSNPGSRYNINVRGTPEQMEALVDQPQQGLNRVVERDENGKATSGVPEASAKGMAWVANHNSRSTEASRGGSPMVV